MRIEAHLAAFQLERAVYGMKGCLECKVNRGSCRIEFESALLRECGDAQLQLDVIEPAFGFGSYVPTGSEHPPSESQRMADADF